MTHSRLSSLGRAEKECEIVRSREILEEVVGERVTSFAYPFGQPDDFDAEDAALVRGGGYRAACANFAGLATSSTDPFVIPRFSVPEGDGDSLAEKLQRWTAA
jgi:peptidoglycan/xylan/chitin deacetylase (PgdA/CDA1 family)